MAHDDGQHLTFHNSPSALRRQKLVQRALDFLNPDFKRCRRRGVAIDRTIPAQKQARGRVRRAAHGVCQKRLKLPARAATPHHFAGGPDLAGSTFARAPRHHSTLREYAESGMELTIRFRFCRESGLAAMPCQPTILARYGVTFSIPCRGISADDFPTMISKSPGTTRQCMSMSSNWRSSGVSFRVTVLVSPGLSATRSNPRSCLTGVETGAYFS